MRSVGLVLPLAVLAAVIFLATRRGAPSGVVADGRSVTGADLADRSVPSASVGGGLISDALDRWVEAGLLTTDQRSSILEHERSEAMAAPAAPLVATRSRRVPAGAEALGYLGGMLAVIGLVLVVQRYWPDMGTSLRLVLSGVATAALLAAGFAVPERSDPAFARLRWFLWLAATATVAVFGGVLAADALDGAPETIVLVSAAAVAALSIALWRGRVRPVQQLTGLSGGTVAVGALVAEVTRGGFSGLVVWVVGATLLLAGLRRWTSTPIVTEAVGAVALLAGAVIAASDWQASGLPLLTASALALLALATWADLATERSDQVVLGVLGGFGLLQATPGTLGYFARDAGGVTGLTTWVMGAIVLAIGARRLVRTSVAAEILGGVALIGGAALTGVQWHGFAPIFGMATAVALVGLGMLPGRVLLSALGSAGLLVNVPWLVAWFFPGEGRVPLLIMVSGALIIAIAVLLTRMGDRFRSDLGSSRLPAAPRSSAPR